MSDNKVWPTSPPAKHDSLLAERYAQAIADQSTLMDNLAKSLLTIELAIPGLYVSVLKLVDSRQGVALGGLTSIAFVCWLIALAATLYAVLPREYPVDPGKIRNAKDSIESFFYASARHKWRFLAASIVFFLAGIGALLGDLVR